MRTAGDVKDWPKDSDPAFNPAAERARWEESETAWRAIGPIFWGQRIPVRKCATRIRELLLFLQREQ